MTKDRAVASLSEWLDASPATSAALYGAVPSPEAAHALTEALSSYTQAAREACLQPLSEHTQLLNAVAGVKLDNPRALLFCGNAARLDRVVISGKGAAIIFVGADAVLENVHIACHAELTIINIGYCSRINGLFAHVYGRIGAVVLGPGTTSESGCNFCIQGNSYSLTGDDVMLSTNVFIRTSDSHGIYNQAGELINNPRPVILHPHVWISRAALLNKGTEVGANTIVGQGSVTAGSFRSGCIYAGAPATMVRSGITWDRRMAKTLPNSHDFAKHHFNPGFRRRIDEINAFNDCALKVIVDQPDISRELEGLRNTMTAAGHSARKTRLSCEVGALAASGTS